MSDALFVDVSNLNVMYKVNGKFCLAVSYASCPEKLSMDAQALGSSFDIYLSMWPRQLGEGDVTINGLSFGGVPFVALKEEIKAVFTLVEKIPGANTIYLCNALANFVIPSRVNNFQAVLCAGSRYALVEVKDKMLASMKMFDSQLDFYETMGEDFTCHGDVDLIDVDTIKAQYPEFSEFKRNIIVPLTPMIMSYRSAYKMTMDEVKTEVFDLPKKQVEEKPKANVTSESEPEPEVAHEEPPIYAPPASSTALAVVDKPQVTKRRQTDILSLLFGFVMCVAAFALGCGFLFNHNAKTERQIQSFSLSEKSYTEDTVFYQSIANVYDKSHNIAAKSMDLLMFAKANTADVTVTSMEVNADTTSVQYSCNSVDASDAFTAYITSRYTVSSKNELSPIENTDGTVTREYRIEVVLD